MATAVMGLPLPRDICAPTQVGDLAALFKPSPSSDEVLVSKEARLIDSLIITLEKYCLASITAPNIVSFRRERRRSWPKYIRSLRALTDTFVNLVPAEVIAKILPQATQELDSDIQRRGPSLFGEKLTAQAVFTLWTIGEIRALRDEITNVEVDPQSKQKDAQLAGAFQMNSLWAQFHLDSLLTAIKYDRPVAEDIRGDVCEGLRAAVNAYALMKSAARLRESTVEEVAPTNLPWDEEDERLLASSMRDLNADFTKDS